MNIIPLWLFELLTLGAVTYIAMTVAKIEQRVAALEERDER